MGIGFFPLPLDSFFPLLLDVGLKVSRRFTDVVQGTGKECFEPQRLGKPQALCNFSAERCDLSQVLYQALVRFG
jgi:hypothetical protein